MSPSENRPPRPGMTVPLPGPLHAHREGLSRLVDYGYTNVWSVEVDGADAFTPLAMAAAWEPRLHLGTAIVPAFTRGPAVLAQSVAALADAAPGRFTVGIGTSSEVIVERWNGIAFVDPYKRVRDVVRFLREALDGSRVARHFDTFHVDGFRLRVRPEHRPQVLVAGLREGMLRLAAREGDGAVINWLSPSDVRQVAAVIHGAAGDAERQIVARIFVCPSDDAALVRRAAKSAIVAYLNVPVYAAFHRWLGRGDLLGDVWAAWVAGDRIAAADAIPDEVVDDLIVHGSVAQCRRRIQEYFDNGVTSSSLMIMQLDPQIDHWTAVEDLSPSAGADA